MSDLMSKTKAEIVADYETLARERDDLAALRTVTQAKYDGLVERIIHEAGQAAAEHDLCSVLDDTLNNIGLAIPQVKVEITTSRTLVLQMPLTDAYRESFLEGGKQSNAAAATAAMELEYDAEHYNEWIVDPEDENGSEYAVKVHIL